jgi:hypothetical protein
MSKVVAVLVHAEHLRPKPKQAAKPAEIRATVRLERAPILTKLSRLRSAVASWNRSGREITPKATRQARLEACKACPYYKADGNIGLGECQAPGCGCSRLKVWLATETCPHPDGSRWH